MVTEADPAARSTADLAPYACTVLDAFGPHRFMFGSDRLVCLLAARYDEAVATMHDLTGGLSGAERAAVFAGTATRVHGLWPSDP